MSHADIERRDGPRYVEAIRGARALRDNAVARSSVMWFDHRDYGAWETEKATGLPVGWATLPEPRP